MTLADSTDLPVIELRNFEFVGPLGRGGMGVVYRARQRHPDREVAIKVVPPDPRIPPALLAMLEAEGDTAAQFDHPNLVHVYECGIVDDHYYLAMQLLPGGDLAQRLKRALPQTEVATITAQIASALGHVHKRGYVHRDVKPSNILFSESGTPVLVDFGVAKVSGTSSELTAAGFSTGTPMYMSPEQIRGAGVDRHSDFYSLGVMLYEMLTGRPPFHAGSAQEIQIAHVRDKPAPLPSQLAVWQPIIDRLLAKDPEDRFSDAGTLITAIKALEQAPASDVTAVQPTTTLVSTAMPARRSRAWLFALAFLGIVVAASVWLREPVERGLSELNVDAIESDPRPSVAVLPLRFHGESDEAASFAEAIHEEVLNQIARVDALRVVSRTSVMRFRESTRSLPEIAATLGVANIIEGSVQRADGAVRINVQLIDARDDTSLWSGQFDRTLTAANLFAIQSDIARAIAAELKAELSEQDEAGLAKAPTQNLEAYQAFLLARQHFHQRLSGQQGMVERAEQLYLQALGHDEGYAEAMAGLASVYAVYRDYSQRRLIRPAEALATEYARRALDIDPTLATPHAVLGFVANDAFDRDDHFRQAVTLEPNNLTAQLWYALAELTAGFIERGEQRLLQARRLDPTSPSVALWLIIAADLRGDTAAALAYGEQGRAMGLTPVQGMLSTIHFRLGNHSVAEGLMRQAVPPNELDAWLEHVVAAPPGGPANPASIEAVLGPTHGASHPHYRVLMLAALGATDAALELIAQRADAAPGAFSLLWRADQPQLRAHHEFYRLASQLGLPAFWRERGFPPACRPIDDVAYRCDIDLDNNTDNNTDTHPNPTG